MPLFAAVLIYEDIGQLLRNIELMRAIYPCMVSEQWSAPASTQLASGQIIENPKNLKGLA